MILAPMGSGLHDALMRESIIVEQEAFVPEAEGVGLGPSPQAKESPTDKQRESSCLYSRPLARDIPPLTGASDPTETSRPV
jgi:hypothetical protein